MVWGDSASDGGSADDVGRVHCAEILVCARSLALSHLILLTVQEAAYFVTFSVKMSKVTQPESCFVTATVWHFAST